MSFFQNLLRPGPNLDTPNVSEWIQGCNQTLKKGGVGCSERWSPNFSFFFIYQKLIRYPGISFKWDSRALCGRVDRYRVCMRFNLICHLKNIHIIHYSSPPPSFFSGLLFVLDRSKQHQF